VFVDTHIKYRPSTIDEFIFPDDRLRELITGYTERGLTRPLILYGSFGTGKSLLAELIPKAIDGDDVQVEKISFDDLNSSKEVHRHFERPKQFDVLFTSNDNLNYHIIEEMGFKERASGALRIMLEKYERTDLVIMTTNRLEVIDGGIQSRAHCAEVKPLRPDQFIDRAMDILRQEGRIAEPALVMKALEARYRREPDNRALYKVLDEMLIAA